MIKAIESIFESATKVSTPVGLAAFVAAALLVIVILLIMKGIFPQLPHGQASRIIILVIERFFLLLLVAIVLGFAAYVILIIHSSKTTSDESSQDQQEQPHKETAPPKHTESEPKLEIPPPSPPPSFVIVNPSPVQMRVDLESGIDLMFGNSFEVTLSKSVDSIASQIKACFADYRVSYEMTVDYAVKVLVTQDGLVVPRSEISNPYSNDLPGNDVEKMKDVITGATFPHPVAYKSTNVVPDSYTFVIRLTFIPQGS